MGRLKKNVKRILHSKENHWRDTRNHFYKKTSEDLYYWVDKGKVYIDSDSIFTWTETKFKEHGKNKNIGMIQKMNRPLSLNKKSIKNNSAINRRKRNS